MKHLNRTKDYYICLTLLLTITLAATHSIASDANNLNYHEVLKIFKRVPQSAKSIEVEKNYHKLLHALGDLPKKNHENDMRAYFFKVVDAFAGKIDSDDEILPLMKRWNEYLLSIKAYSNINYYNVIKSQQMDYMKAITDLSASIQKYDSYRKDYSSTWIDELIANFGEDFIKSNRDAIISSLYAITTDTCYEKELKELVYTETMLYGSYQKYFGMFLDFYKEKLSDEEQNKLRPRKDAAEAFLALLNNNSITSIYEDKILGERLSKNKALSLNKELLPFLKERIQPHTLDLIRALKDLRKFYNNENSFKLKGSSPATLANFGT